MTEYEEMIKRLAKERINEVFYNSSDSHARIVLNSMVENAEKYVHIVCGNMCSEVSTNPEFLGIVKNFLSKDSNRTLYVLFDEYCSEFLNNDLAKVLAEYPYQVIVRKFKEKMHLTYKGVRAHLTTSDNRAYRLETNVTAKMAFGNFNDEEKVKVFDDVFNRFFSDDNYSERINLTNDVA